MPAQRPLQRSNIINGASPPVAILRTAVEPISRRRCCDQQEHYQDDQTHHFAHSLIGTMDPSSA